MKRRFELLVFSCGFFVLTFGVLLPSPSIAQGSVGEVEDWICCYRFWAIGCTDKGGVFGSNDVYISGNRPTCS
jgi:hypothetical protein